MPACARYLFCSTPTSPPSAALSLARPDQRDRYIRVCVCVCVCVCCVCRSVYVNAYATSSYHHVDESKRQKLLCALRLRLHEIKAACTPRWCDRAHMEKKSLTDV
eukprot:Tamp_40213.p1 GENE.Tamp_40213~~Tamp_40213.p1  ORF type:complete len:105 (+),score=0.71 Tamp_40213:68-382(+)